MPVSLARGVSPPGAAAGEVPARCDGDTRTFAVAAMTTDLETFIRRATGAAAVRTADPLQELWSGYGFIKRLHLEAAKTPTVILKHVRLPADQQHHPRGWNTDQGHRRKVRSYQVEAHFYRHYSEDSGARLPRCLAVERAGEDVLLLLEDLDASGFHLRKTQVTWPDIATCLRWLARFHAGFLGRSPEGLWLVGTYWHLDTRPQELAALDDERLRAAAALIDDRLNACAHQTLVHGDAKLANFCFAPADSPLAGAVAGLDFQYVGGGCGMKDVTYFIGSCLGERDCERLEARILDTYFDALHEALGETHAALEAEWRALYPVAWADFHRFLKGWSPGHWKLNSYSERVTAAVIVDLT